MIQTPPFYQQVINFLKENPGHYFGTKEIAAAIIKQYPEYHEVKRKIQNEERESSGKLLFSDQGFQQQVASKVSRFKKTIQKKEPNIRVFDSYRPHQFWYEIEPPKSSNPVIEEIDSKKIDFLLKETMLDEQRLRLIISAINRKRQIILTGPPGTGKTHLAQNLANYLTSETDGLIETIQLHPAYTYEDFMQGLRPIADKNGQLTYKMMPGRFLDFCDRARQCHSNSVLIIDEINRANLSAVFGELLYLLEYRDRTIKLATSKASFSIPSNVYIIGTMNTADRSIALVDHALRRRFAFIELAPDYSILKQWHEREQTGFNPDGLIAILEQINTTINDKNYAIGISFFLTDNLNETIADIWQLEIYPYLEELFYSNLEQIEAFQWDTIKERIQRDRPVSDA